MCKCICSCNEYDGRQRAGFKRRAHQVFICIGPPEGASSGGQGQGEGHTQVVQKGNSTGREKASNVVRERQGKRLMTGNPIGKSTGRE